MVVKLETGGRIDRDKHRQGRWSSCNTAATTWPSPAAASGCAARPSTSSRAITRTAPGASPCSATISRRSRNSIPLTGEKAADLDGSPSTRTATTSRRARRSPRPCATSRSSCASAWPKLIAERPPAGGTQRLEQRTTFDIEMMETTGRGAARGSRTTRATSPAATAGEPPPTLFEYLPENALLIVDESHVTVPQIGGMERGDHARKSILAEYGFRLPSCIDNRPLKFEEWERFSPADHVRQRHPRPVGAGARRRRVRRAGDPPDRPDRPGDRCGARSRHQVDDLLGECKACVIGQGRARAGHHAGPSAWPRI